jgi:hypothetical protein
MNSIGALKRMSVKPDRWVVQGQENGWVVSFDWGGSQPALVQLRKARDGLRIYKTSDAALADIAAVDPGARVSVIL